jgi:arginine utilization protein RocB
MKSLADQLREELVKPGNKQARKKNEARTAPLEKSKKQVLQLPAIMEALLNYDNSLNKSMVHVRFDEKTVRTMNQFKMATQVDVTRLVAFAVKHLFDTCPELKLIIKQFIQNTEL